MRVACERDTEPLASGLEEGCGRERGRERARRAVDASVRGGSHQLLSAEAERAGTTRACAVVLISFFQPKLSVPDEVENDLSRGTVRKFQSHGEAPRCRGRRYGTGSMGPT